MSVTLCLIPIHGEVITFEYPNAPPKIILPSMPDAKCVFDHDLPEDPWDYPEIKNRVFRKVCFKTMSGQAIYYEEGDY